MRMKHIAVPTLCLVFVSIVSGQQMCADVPGQTSATHRFHREGEKIEIALRDDSDPACEPVDFELHWANGRNNGSNFNITFLDGNQRPVLARQISAFLTGVLNFPLSSFGPQPVHGSSMELISVPTTVRIEAVSPFAGSVNLSYSIRRARANGRGKAGRENGGSSATKTEPDGNEAVNIHDAVRLIGSTRLPLVQLELRTTRPFPVRDVPLQLQIGEKVFVDELSGDHTGRRLTLSLTPEMFAELNDGDEIVACFGPASSLPVSSEASARDMWRFGKLEKNKRQQ